MNKLKNLPTEKTCDIFLRELYNNQRNEAKVPFLNDILDNKKIYYDKETIETIIELLQEKELIQAVPNSISIFSFERPDKNKLTSEEKITELLRNADGSVSQYRLTKKGWRFVSSGQKLHQAGNIVKQSIEKIQSIRILAYIILSAIVITTVIGFYEKISTSIKLFTLTGNSETSVILPFQTGWIFAGYYHFEEKKFIEGPYFEIVKSPYDKDSLFPRVGDWIKIINDDREVIISDFKTEGLTNILRPPWKQNILTNVDRTGLIIPKGSIVSVKEESSGYFPNKPFGAVYLRIGRVKTD